MEMKTTAPTPAMVYTGISIAADKEDGHSSGGGRHRLPDDHLRQLLVLKQIFGGKDYQQFQWCARGYVEMVDKCPANGDHDNREEE